MSEDFVLDQIKNRLLNFDPVNFVEKHLTIDGDKFNLQKSGWKPFADIYRYIGIKALEKGGKPVIIVAGRQLGKTTLASALEMYFMGSGNFGNGKNPPIRVAHAFPALSFASDYSKTKLNSMMYSSIMLDTTNLPKGTKSKPYMVSLIDSSSESNNSQQFKQFTGGNHLWIESCGEGGKRLRGKQLALDTELPTPTGFIRLADLKEGDQLFDENGNICNVVKMHPINVSPESYRITFDDDTIVDACADHLWLTYTKQNRVAMTKLINNKSKYRPDIKVKTTKELFTTLKVGTKIENNHSIPNCLPVKYSNKDLPIDPYLFGLWLGDGDSNGGAIESADPEMFNGYGYRVTPSSIGKSKSMKYRIAGLTAKLRKLGLPIDTSKINRRENVYIKCIPDEYMQASYEQRLALVQGLMDTDGSCDLTGRIEFTSVIPRLAKDVHQLLLSLGIKAHIIENESWLYGKRCQNRFRINFITKVPVFRLERKLQHIRTHNRAMFSTTHRFITNIEKIDPVPMRCITVDSPSHLFLITRSFIPTHNTMDVIFFDEVQLMYADDITNSLKTLTQSKYGNVGEGVQVFFGTPLQRGSTYWDMWNASSQQYYHLGCGKCKEYFPLYTPGTNEWEETWIYGFTVRCPHCGFEQDKREAVEKGKWIATKDSTDAKYIGFHINQLYVPNYTKEKIISEKPENNPASSEKGYQNEVLGEFYHGEATIITQDQVRELCGDPERKFRARISPDEDLLVFMGIDIGGRNDLAQLVDSNRVKQQGQSYSTAVVIAMTGPQRMSIERAVAFKKNDLASKKGIIEELMRDYSVNLAICDLGYANDLNEILQNEYGDKFLSSQATNRVNEHIKFSSEIFPKTIVFERDYWIAELYDQMKKGNVRIPMGSYEQIYMLIQHICSMEIKPSISRSGDITPHYVKGSSPNDFFMAILNAYLAYKFYVSDGFNIKNPFMMKDPRKVKPPIISGYIPKMR